MTIRAITPIKIGKAGSAVNDLVQSAMKDFGGVTPAKAKKVLPKALDADVLVVKSETKQKVRMGGDCGGSYSSDSTPCGCGDYFCCPN